MLCGGDIPEGPGYFMPYTIVADVKDGMRIVDEEQFGPLLPVIKYSNLDDALQSANGLDTGLGGSVWSSDPARGALKSLRSLNAALHGSTRMAGLHPTCLSAA